MTRWEIVNQTSGQSVTSNACLLRKHIARARGLMFKLDIPEDAAFIFSYFDTGRRGVHMLFVFEPLDVLWISKGRVERKERLQPFIGHAAAHAQHVIEFPAGGADGVRVGDRIAWGPAE